MNSNDFRKAMDLIDPEFISEAESASKKASWKKWVCIAACAAILIAGTVLLVNPVRPDAPAAPSVQPDISDVQSQPALPLRNYLTLDVNPSVELVLENGLIVECSAINDDGQIILQELELVGLTVQEAMPLLLQALIDNGYLSAGNQTQALLLSAHGEENPGELLDAAHIAAAEILSGTQVYIIAQQLEVTQTLELLAQQYNVSVGKMQLMLMHLKEGGLSLEETSAHSVMELYGEKLEKLAVANRYQAGDYDENGNLVLYDGPLETDIGDVPFDSLPPAYQEHLRETYSPEDIAIMETPRKWVTVPDVVGLTEAEAREAMHSLGIPVRILYTNDAMVRTMGYSDGLCYYMDVSPGMRWNTDAAIYLWILVSEDPGIPYCDFVNNP